MRSLTIEQVYRGEGFDPDHRYRVYVIRDGEVNFYVGQSQDPYWRLWEHLGRGDRGILSLSPVGELIRRHLPTSWSWSMDLYTLEDCLPFVQQYKAGEFAWYKQYLEDILVEKFIVDTAESALIVACRPYLNVSRNMRERRPLPEKYQ